MQDIKTSISLVSNELRLTAFSQYALHTDPKLPFEENLLALLKVQAKMAEDKRVERRVKYAGFPLIKSMDTFEMSRERLPYLNFDEVRELTTCKFIDDKLDVVAIGSSGHGKTHIALAVGYAAARRGYTVKFKRASDLVNEMNEMKTEKRLTEYTRMLNRCQLLIIDEFGYLDYDLSAADMLFQILGARYETGSTFYTSNADFSEWVNFIGGKSTGEKSIGEQKLAAAMVSRISHHSIVLNMNGPSNYRLDHAWSKEHGAGREKQSPTSAPPTSA